MLFFAGKMKTLQTSAQQKPTNLGVFLQPKNKLGNAYFQSGRDHIFMDIGSLRGAGRYEALKKKRDSYSYPKRHEKEQKSTKISCIEVEFSITTAY